MKTAKKKALHLTGGASPNLVQATDTLSALSNPQRLRLLCHLVEERELSVGSLVEKLGISQSALSQHLAKLRTLGIVETRKESQLVYYRIAREDIHRIITVLHEVYCG